VRAIAPARALFLNREAHCVRPWIEVSQEGHQLLGLFCRNVHLDRELEI
jgi:hypothetical protein